MSKIVECCLGEVEEARRSRRMGVVDETVEATQVAVRRSFVGLLPYQLDALGCKARFTWNCWARQTGKSFTFSLRRVLRGLARRRNQIILSAGERQSREVMEKVRLHCQALRVWHEWHRQRFFRGTTSFQQLEVRLPGGIRIIGLPANPMTARGFTGDVFLDEFAMHADDAAIWSGEQAPIWGCFQRCCGERANWTWRRRHLERADETIGEKKQHSRGSTVDHHRHHYLDWGLPSSIRL